MHNIFSKGMPQFDKNKRKQSLYHSKPMMYSTMKWNIGSTVNDKIWFRNEYQWQGRVNKLLLLHMVCVCVSSSWHSWKLRVKDNVISHVE